MDSHDAVEHPAIDSFIALGLIAEVLHPVASGKEATVFCCRGGPSPDAAGAPFLAAKVYREREHRSFRDDARYQEGRFWQRRPSRATRAFATKSRFGREVQQGTWVEHEWTALRALHAAGADVPRPVASAAGGILMEHFGEGDRVAPQLRSCELTRDEAQAVFDRLVANVRLMLARDVVHGDLSPYNVLYLSPRELRIIDLPQSVDARFNSSARELLARDVANVHRFCARFGARGDPERLAAGLWHRYALGEL